MNLLWQFFCMIAFGAACWATGDILLKVFTKKNFALPHHTHFFLAFAIGNVGMSYLLTLIGFTVGFVQTVLWAVFFGGIGITVWHVIFEFNRRTRRAYNSAEQNGIIPCGRNQAIQDQTGMKRDWVLYFLIGIIAVFCIPAVFQAAAPPYLRDSLVYHLLCPKEYLKIGHFVHIEGNIFSAFPKGHEVLMTLLLSISGDRAAQGFSILQQIAAIGELYGLTAVIGGPFAAMICTIGYATVPPVMYFSGCGYVEPALLMSLGGSLLVLFFSSQLGKDSRTEANSDWGAISLLGFLAGWMPAVKYNGLIYFGLVALIVLWDQRKVSSKKGLSVIVVFSISAAPGLCWMIWNWIDLANPIYPMAWLLFGGKGWDETRAVSMSQYLDIYGMGRSLWDYLMLPWNLAVAGKFDTIRFDGATGPFLVFFLLLAIATAVLLIRRRLVNMMLPEIGVMLVISAAFFIFGTQQVRFWMPSQMLICIFVAPVLALIIDFIRGKWMLKTALILAVILSLSWNTWFLSQQFVKVGCHKPVLGLEGERAFLVRQVPGFRELEFLNQNLPERSRILCVWTGAYGYYIDRFYYSDTFIEDVTLKKLIDASKDGRELSQSLSKAGFTHLFFRVSVLLKNMKPQQQSVFVDLLRRGAFELFTDGDYSIFKIQTQ